MDEIPGVGHEFSALPGMAEHYAFGTPGFCRQDARQHVVVIGNDNISISFFSIRETEKIYDERRIHHFLLPTITPGSQCIEKVYAMYVRQPSRNASKFISQPNTVISSQERHATVVIATHSTCIFSLSHHIVDAVEIIGASRPPVPPCIQTQLHRKFRSRRGHHEAIGHYELYVFQSVFRDDAIPAVSYSGA